MEVSRRPCAKRWIPLEANPEVMSQFAWGLGIPEEEAEFHDVYGYDDELLDMVPKPVLAVIFLYPLNDATNVKRSPEEQQVTDDGQKGVSSNVYFMQQTVENACGTVAVVHAVGNILPQLHIRNGSFFERFFTSTAEMTPAERAEFLENDTELESAHSVAASAGHTVAPDLSVNVDLHFVCLTCVDGKLYELDGRWPSPTCHGPSSPETLLKDAVGVIQNVSKKIPDSVNFSVIALSKKT